MPAAAPDYDGLDFGMLSDLDLEQMLQDALHLRETGLVNAVRRELARRRGAPPLLTPEAFAAAMRRLDTSTDREGAHSDADALMGQVLTALGYGEGVTVFEAMVKWYA